MDQPHTWIRCMPERRFRRGLALALWVLIFGLLPAASQVAAVVVRGSIFLAMMLIPITVTAFVILIGGLVTCADLRLSFDRIDICLLGPFTLPLPMSATRIMLVEEWDTPTGVRAMARLMLGVDWPRIQSVAVGGVGLLQIVGMCYGLGRVPVFILTSDHQGREALIRRIDHAHHPLKQRRGRSIRWRR